MPFVSKQQERWAFATHQPFAKKWADMTNQKSLPKRKKPSNKNYSRKAIVMATMGNKGKMT